jgi:hypothetical protein
MLSIEAMSALEGRGVSNVMFQSFPPSARVAVCDGRSCLRMVQENVTADVDGCER